MKKIIVAIGGVIALLMSLLFFTGANENNNSPAQVRKEYAIFQERLQKNVDTSADQEELFSIAERICAKIADGSASNQTEYAQLLREITKNTIQFQDEEVFDIARELAEVYAIMSEGEADFGIQNVRIAKTDTEEMLLLFDYIGVRGYSVRMMQEDDMEYSGDYLVAYDGSLGKNRIEITFYDARASEKFMEQYAPWQVHDLQSDFQSGLKLKGVYTPDHGFIVYIGTDEAIHVEEQSFTETNHPKGTIQINIGK